MAELAAARGLLASTWIQDNISSSRRKLDQMHQSGSAATVIHPLEVDRVGIRVVRGFTFEKPLEKGADVHGVAVEAVLLE